jgi:hypothetical protein
VQQARQAEQLAGLQRAIEAKEATWQRLAGGQGRFGEAAARFEADLAELRAEKAQLQRERAQLLQVATPGAAATLTHPCLRLITPVYCSNPVAVPRGAMHRDILQHCS